jgi:hypothetical protein
MSESMECFATEELEELTPHQLELLRHATRREIRNNPEIRRIIRESVQPIYDRMTGQAGPRRPPSPRTPRPRRPRGPST